MMAATARTAARLTPRLLLAGLGLPEAPRWKDGRLFFSDVWCGEVVAVDMEGRRETIASVPNRPSGLGWLPDGRLVVVSMLDCKLLVQDAADGHVMIEAADLSALAGDLCNEMIIDAHGRAYIGGYRGGPGRDNFERRDNAVGANLLLVDFSVDAAAPVVRVVASDLRIPNGTAIAPDGTTLVVAETGGRRLTAFTIDPDGSLSNRRLWAPLDVYPDGICFDVEGCIWVAANTPGGFQRIAEGGEVLDRIEPSSHAGFACVLGGEDRRMLFLLEAPYPSQPHERLGRIRTARTATPGAGLP